MSASRALALAMLFFAYAVLFRYLGPYGSGQYQFVLSFVLIFGIISDFGVQQFITKKMSENPEKLKEYFQDFLNFEILLSVFLFTALVFTAWLKNLEMVVFQAVAVAGLGMCLNALTFPFLSVMTVKGDLKKVAFINFLNSLVNIAVIFLAVLLKKYIVFLAVIQPVFALVDIVLYRRFITAHIPSLQILKNIRVWHFGNIKNILSSAWPFALLAGFSAIYNRIDVVIISHFTGYAQTGIYTAAYKFVDLLNFFPASVSHILFPIFAALVAGGQVLKARETLEKYLRLMIAVALPLAVGGFVLAKPLVLLVAGKDFAASAPVLSVLVWAIAILFVYIPVNSLVISQQTKKAAAITGANMLFNIIGNIILVPKYGVLAAAFLTVASESIQAIFYFYFVKTKITDFSFFKYVGKPFFASLLMGIVIYYFVAQPLIFVLPLGVFVYALGLYMAKFFNREDLIFIKSFLKNN